MKRLIIEVYRNKNVRLKAGWRWRMRSSNQLVVGASTEGYARRARAIENLQLVTGIALPKGTTGAFTIVVKVQR